MIDLKQLATLPKWRIPEVCEEKFCEIYRQKWGEDPTAFFEQQKNLFIQEVNAGQNSTALQRASGFSLMNAFMFLAIFNLSLERCSTTTCYLEVRAQKSGKKDANGKDVYVTTATITVTGYGEILIRQRARQIKGADSPVVIYNCDHVEFGEKDGHKYLNFTKAWPRPDDAIVVGCYVRIIKNDGTPDYFLMDIEEIRRLRKYSARFGRTANALYGAENCYNIDTGFLKAKCIKHAFKGYPRLELTDGGSMESDKDEAPAPVEVNRPEAPTPPAEVAEQGVQVKQEADTPFD